MKRERQIFYSVIASVAVHLALFLIAVLLIGLSGLFPPEPVQASLVNEVVIYLPEMVPETKPEEPKGKRFIRTNEKSRVDEAPMDAAFESDRNTVAASEAAPAADPDTGKPVPTQEGVEDVRFMELDDREYVDGAEPSEDASMPSPAVAVAMATPTPTPMMPRPESAVMPLPQSEERQPKPAATDLRENSFSDRLDPIVVRPPEKGEEIIEGEEKPTTEAREALAERMTEREPQVAEREATMAQEAAQPTKPAPANEAFRPHTRSTSMSGTISNRGASSVSAAETPLGRYKASVSQAIERKWHRYRQDKAEFLVYGSIKLEFRVDRRGRPRNLKILENDANAVMADFTLSAILEADIPPMPEEILDILDNETLEVTYDIIIY